MEIKTVLFILTFIPYALVPLGGILGAVLGVNFFFNRCYKFGGFLLGSLETLGGMIVIPVIPVCIVFHLLCLLRKTVPFIRNMGANKFAAACVVICFTVFITLLIDSHSHKIEKRRQKKKAKRMSARADEKIAFKKSDICYGGIFGMPEYKTNHIFIDYGKNDVGFLIYADCGKYFEIHLAETSPRSPEYRHIADTYFVQSDIPLSSPGKRLVSFSDERYINRTAALLLFYEDGRIFYADNIREKKNDCGEYLGLGYLKELIRLEDDEKNIS